MCCPIISEMFIKFDKGQKYNSISSKYYFILKLCRTNIHKLFITNIGAMVFMECHKCTTYLRLKRILKNVLL